MVTSETFERESEELSVNENNSEKKKMTSDHWKEESGLLGGDSSYPPDCMFCLGVGRSDPLQL